MLCIIGLVLSLFLTFGRGQQNAICWCDGPPCSIDISSNGRNIIARGRGATCNRANGGNGRFECHGGANCIDSNVPRGKQCGKGRLDHPRGFAAGRECCSARDIVKCTRGEGDCDTDSACAGSLVCGVDNCRGSNCHREDDLCTSRREKRRDCRRKRGKRRKCRCGRRRGCIHDSWNIEDPYGIFDEESMEAFESLQDTQGQVNQHHGDQGHVSLYPTQQVQDSQFPGHVGNVGPFAGYQGKVGPFSGQPGQVQKYFGYQGKVGPFVGQVQKYAGYQGPFAPHP